MRILFTSSGPWGTGSFSVLDAILPELASRGHEVKVFFPQPSDMKHSEDDKSRPFDWYHGWQFPISNGQTHVETFPLIIADPNPHNDSGKTYQDLSKAQFDLFFDHLKHELHSVIDEFKPDVIECNHIWAMAYAMSELQCPYVVSAHNSDQIGYQYDKRMQPYADQAAQRARHIISISDKNKNDIMGLYHVNDQKVTTITNSYNADIFRPMQLDRQQLLASLNLDIPDDAIIINLTGKISRTKGVDVLLKANKLLSKQRQDIHILILGAGKFEDVIDSGDEDSYCFDRVHALGHLSPKTAAAIHNISRMSVMPSRSEGFPVACTEALGCSLPVVITELGGVEQFVVGRIIPQQHPERLAQAIVELAELPDQDYRQLQDQALAVAKSYTWAKNVDQRLSVYQDFIHA